MTSANENKTTGQWLLRLVIRCAAAAAVVAAVVWLTDWAMTEADTAKRDGLIIGVTVALLLAYAILMAVPFVPGIEIGLGLLMMKGATIAPFVYAATVTGLALAFLAGRLLPARWLRNTLLWLRLRRAAQFLDRLDGLSETERLDLLTRQAPRWLQRSLRPGRYLLVAALLNLPGNGAIGGGGGIAFAAGLSRMFHPSITLLVFSLAVLPVPLAVWLNGGGAGTSP